MGDSIEFCMFLSGGLQILEYWGMLGQIIGGYIHPIHPHDLHPCLGQTPVIH